MHTRRSFLGQASAASSFTLGAGALISKSLGAQQQTPKPHPIGPTPPIVIQPYQYPLSKAVVSAASLAASAVANDAEANQLIPDHVRRWQTATEILFDNLDEVGGTAVIEKAIRAKSALEPTMSADQLSKTMAALLQFQPTQLQSETFYRAYLDGILQLRSSFAGGGLKQVHADVVAGIAAIAKFADDRKLADMGRPNLERVQTRYMTNCEYVNVAGAYFATWGWQLALELVEFGPIGPAIIGGGAAVIAAYALIWC